MAGSVPPIWQSGDGRRFVKSFELSVEDHLAGRYARTEALPFGRFAAFVTLCTAFAGLLLFYGPWKAGDRWLAAGIVAAAIAAGPLLAWLLYGFFRGLFRGFWKGFLGAREAIEVPLEVTADCNGLAVLVRQQTWMCPWDSLLAVEEDGGRYYFWTSKTQAHVLPKRLFEADERTAFDEALKDWLGHAPVSPPRLAGAQHQDWGEPGAQRNAG